MLKKQKIVLLVIITISSSSIVSCNYIKERRLVSQLESISGCIGDEDIKNIWKNPKANMHIRNIVKNTSYANKARFFAAEILFKKDKNYPPDKMKGIIAYIFAKALIEKYACSYNTWGYPYATRRKGLHFIRLGTEALPALMSLLDNNKRMIFDGSSDAYHSSLYRFRIKDMAAVFICHICHIEFKVYRNVSKREKQIERIKKYFVKGKCKPRKYSELNVEPDTHSILPNDTPDEYLYNNK